MTSDDCCLCNGRGFYGSPGATCQFCKGTGKVQRLPGVQVSRWVKRCRHPDACIAPRCGDFCHDSEPMPAGVDLPDGWRDA